MKFLSLIITFLTVFSSLLSAQIVDKGEPRYQMMEKMEIPVLILPDVNLKKLQREDKRHAQSRLKSMRFAKIIEVGIDPEVDGEWNLLSNGDKVWHLKVKSPGAYSLSLLFDQYRLPVGAELYVYSADQKHVRGSFTFKNNKWNSILPIAPVKGDEIIIEYFEPKSVAFKGELHISSIAHDYMDVFKYLSKGEKGFGDSGDCNVNINCDNDEMWQLLKHSVCKITYNGWLCSGALINNTSEDEKPYFLTANHCIANNYNASAAVFYFNYESPDCENIDGPKDQTIAGSVIVATPAIKSLDFSLLELSEKPPAIYKPYYAGWNRDIANPDSVASIHHPSGDIKKISKAFDGAITGDYGEGYNEYTHWWIDTWDEGTTEGGSSGSPLFNKHGKIIGDLTGGDASCTYNYNDYYQQLYHSWSSINDIDQQLKHWLDPKNTGLVSLDGYLPYDTIPSNLKFSLTDTIIDLSWNNVIDTSIIECYYIYKNNIKVDSIHDNFYTDTVLSSLDTLHSYFITAKYDSPDTIESGKSNSVYIRIMNSLTLPFSETFESKDTIPSGWYEERSNDTIGWQFKEGGFAAILDTAFQGVLNAYYYNDEGESSKLVLPKFDFSAYTNLKLSFYLLMQAYNDDIHQLNILYKSADSTEWNIIRSFDTFLDDWDKKEIPLPDLSSDYYIAFEGIGLGGFGIAIDSISVRVDGKFLEVDFTSDKDLMCIYDSVLFSTNLDVSNDFYWDFGLSAIPQNATGAGPHWVKYSSVGIKSTQLRVNDTYIKQGNEAIVVFGLPKTPSFTNSGDYLISSSEVGNQWYFNEEPIGGATENTFLITEDGYYSVEVTNSFGCSSISESKYMIVSDIEDPIEYNIGEGFLQVFPNPNDGKFSIRINTSELSNVYQYDIIDITGKVIYTSNIETQLLQEVYLSDVNEGLFLVKVYSGNSYYTSKIIIKK